MYNRKKNKHNTSFCTTIKVGVGRGVEKGASFVPLKYWYVRSGTIISTAGDGGLEMLAYSRMIIIMQIQDH